MTKKYNKSIQIINLYFFNIYCILDCLVLCHIKDTIIIERPVQAYAKAVAAILPSGDAPILSINTLMHIITIHKSKIVITVIIVGVNPMFKIFGIINITIY